MARRRRSREQRGNFPTANPWLSAHRITISPLDLSVFEDRRTFHPLQDFRPALTFGKRSSARVVDKVKPARASFAPSNFHFAVPDKVAICVRRKRRKEVLHALKRVGAGNSRRRRRNYWSDVKC